MGYVLQWHNNRGNQTKADGSGHLFSAHGEMAKKFILAFYFPHVVFARNLYLKRILDSVIVITLIPRYINDNMSTVG